MRTSGILERFPSEIATTTSSGSIHRFGNLVPRDIASRAAKNVCDEGRGVGPGGLGVYLDFADAISAARAANGRKPSTATSSRCTPRSPAKTRTQCRCGSIRPSTTRWVGSGSTTTLRSSIPGLYVTGEANFSDHGANRLGASALMQGLADGYFVLPNTINDYLADGPFPKVDGVTSDRH